MRTPVPTLASWVSPARVTASIAVARKSGGSGSATGRQLLDHAHFHPAFRPAAKRDVVHEVAHEKDAAAAGFEDVLGSEGIGDFLGLEAFTLIEHAHDQLARGCRR